MRILPDPIAFDWDKGNIVKNFIKHSITDKEAEEIFRNEPKFIFKDEKHSDIERRFMVWGITNKNKRLAIFFTIRNKKIRIISARDMNIRERREYEKNIKTDTTI